jgi:hypothetical protein
MAVKVSIIFRNRYNSIPKCKGKRVAIVTIAPMLAKVAFRILRDKNLTSSHREIDPRSRKAMEEDASLLLLSARDLKK